MKLFEVQINLPAHLSKANLICVLAELILSQLPERLRGRIVGMDSQLKAGFAGAARQWRLRRK